MKQFYMNSIFLLEAILSLYNYKPHYISEICPQVFQAKLNEGVKITLLSHLCLIMGCVQCYYLPRLHSPSPPCPHHKTKRSKQNQAINKSSYKILFLVKFIIKQCEYKSNSIPKCMYSHVTYPFNYIYMNIFICYECILNR